jgi:hypothetical protein
VRYEDIVGGKMRMTQNKPVMEYFEVLFQYSVRKIIKNKAFSQDLK